jgi:N-acetylglucosamine-6-phosphate deacetylase
MASHSPAAFLRLGADHGRIAPGCSADLVALDESLQVTATWIAGIGDRHAEPALPFTASA